MKLTLPDTPFADLAVELGLAAREQARGVELLETTVIRDESEIIRRIRETALTDCRQSALRLAEGHDLLRLLSPFEDEIRGMLARAAMGRVA